MTRERLVLLLVIAACIFDLVRCRRAVVLRVLLVAGESSSRMEGFVRHLHWEYGLRNGFLPEIAVSWEGAGSDCLAVREILERDGLVVPENSGEPCLVFHV